MPVPEHEILELEDEFGKAMISNDAEAIGCLLDEDWIIVGPDGHIIDKSRFLGVIKSGALHHEAMDSEDVRVRVFGDTATVTAVTTSKTVYQGLKSTTRERATDVFARQNGEWKCVLTHLTTLAK